MYRVLYRCVYREWWYDGPETDDWTQACQIAQQIKMQRRTAVMIVNQFTGEQYAC